MLPKRFDQAKPFVTLGLAAVAWLIVPAVVKRTLRLSFFEVRAPVEATASFVHDLQDFWALRTHTNNELIEAGRQTASVLAGYELSVQQKDQLDAENRRLRELLNLPAEPGYRFEHARVMERDFSGWWQQLTIRKGANYGLTVGAPVVCATGVVGRVREVHAYTAVVDLISSPAVRIAAVIEGDTRPLSFQGGDNPTLGPARGVVEYLPVDVVASESAPRRLFTSGLGGVFPARLPIGLLTHVEPSSDGLFKTGEVRLDPGLAALAEVTVLVPLPATADAPPP